jgi:AbrB family looped-hinge helix DNA binding protein
MKVAISAQSVVSVRGQTVIPKEVREVLGIKEGTKLLWFVEDDYVVVQGLPDDPIKAAKGALKQLNVSTADLLAERRADRDKEEAKVEEMLERWRSTS